MIFSDRQYAVSKAQLEKLRDAAERAKADTGKHPRLREIEANAFKSQIADIERDGPGARGSVLRGKTISAELAESCTSRLCHVVGGGSYSQRSPFGHWFEDVRALGFLRPPWGLAFDGLIADRS